MVCHKNIFQLPQALGPNTSLWRNYVILVVRIERAKQTTVRRTEIPHADQQTVGTIQVGAILWLLPHLFHDLRMSSLCQLDQESHRSTHLHHLTHRHRNLACHHPNATRCSPMVSTPSFHCFPRVLTHPLIGDHTIRQATSGHKRKWWKRSSAT